MPGRPKSETPRAKATKAPKAGELQLVRIEALNAAPYNPRVMDAEELSKLAASLREFGWLEPVVANLRGARVVGGHQRLQAAASLGMEEVPVMWVGPLSDEQERAANLALNRITGRWDFEKLADVLSTLGSSPALQATGFTETELDELLGGRGSAPAPAPAAPDAGLGGFSFAGEDRPFAFGAFKGTVPEAIYVEFKRRWELGEAAKPDLSLSGFLRTLLGLPEEPRVEDPAARR